MISAAVSNAIQPMQANIDKRFAFLEGKISQMDSTAARSFLGDEQGGLAGKRPAPRLKSVVSKVPAQAPQTEGSIPSMNRMTPLMRRILMEVRKLMMTTQSRSPPQMRTNFLKTIGGNLSPPKVLPLVQFCLTPPSGPAPKSIWLSVPQDPRSKSLN